MYNLIMKEFISICGIIPEDINEKIKEICLKENEDLKLSDRFFRFQLHVSMKRTFLCSEFEEMKADVKSFLVNEGKICCGYSHLIRNKDMLWLILNDDKKLKEVHSGLDRLLLDKYGVPIDTFDKHYLPHVTIFHKGDPENMNIMEERLYSSLPSFPVTIESYAIGTKIKGYEFFNVY